MATSWLKNIFSGEADPLNKNDFFTANEGNSVAYTDACKQQFADSQALIYAQDMASKLTATQGQWHPYSTTVPPVPLPMSPSPTIEDAMQMMASLQSDFRCMLEEVRKEMKALRKEVKAQGTANPYIHSFSAK